MRGPYPGAGTPFCFGAPAVSGAGGQSLDVLRNPLGDAGLAALLAAAAAAGSVGSVVGLAPGQAAAAWADSGLGPFDLKMIAGDLATLPAGRALRRLELSKNKLFGLIVNSGKV